MGRKDRSRRESSHGPEARARACSLRSTLLRVPLAVAVLAVAVLSALAPSAGAAAASAKVVRLADGKGYEVIRPCVRPRPGRRSCLSIGHMRLRSLAALPAARTGSPPISPYSELPAGTLTPEDLSAAYSLQGETPASQLQTIAIIDAYGDLTAESDLAAYDQQFELPACTARNGCFRKVNQEGNKKPLPKANPEWSLETALDLEMAHAVCHSCRLLLVVANSSSVVPEAGQKVGDLELAVETAVRLGATEISNSWSEPETLPGESKEFPGEYPTPAASASFDHPGVAITAAAGDCGYLNEANLIECPELPRRVEFPASSPTVVSVGGTKLEESSGVWSATAWSDGGSGCSTFFSAPPWQSADSSYSATGCAGARAVADVSATASEEPGVAVYLGSTPVHPGEPVGWYYVSGTSVAAPIVAGEFGLAGGSHGVEYPAATLYSHAGESSDLYDVTSGSNGSCGGLSICNAVAGYDGPTGIGSPLGVGAFGVIGSPETSSPPKISGNARLGGMLTVVPGEWTGTPTTVNEQWAECNRVGTFCAPIAGATGPSYTLVRADLRRTLRVQETASNASGTSAPVASAPTEKVR
jgi:hypothetical protein